MYLTRRVWLFNSAGKGEVFEFKTEKEEIAKKEQGWTEEKPSETSEPLPVSEVKSEEPVIKETETAPEAVKEEKKTEPDDDFDEEKYPITFSGENE